MREAKREPWKVRWCFRCRRRVMQIAVLMVPTAEDLCESAWGIIANAHGGNWDEALDEWREAAERWRDGWHHLLDRTLRPDA